MCALDGLPLAPALALGLQVAACRETYEEAGVLLARHRDGRPPSAAELEALTSARHEARAAGAFLDLVASADLLLDVDRLVYWSHWITPSQEPRRFDTRFFAVASPEGQAASLDRREAVELAWLAPHSVWAAAANGDMLIAPPTQLTLEDIDEAYARHGSVSAMLTAERGRATPPVMPRVVAAGATVQTLMPWDPDYAQAPGDGCVAPAAYPPHLARRDSRLLFPRAAAR
jgi:8-oxo-dGTP pyrophosphatase MutT (NUDIX family)